MKKIQFKLYVKHCYKNVKKNIACNKRTLELTQNISRGFGKGRDNMGDFFQFTAYQIFSKAYITSVMKKKQSRHSQVSTHVPEQMQATLKLKFQN